MNSETKVVNFYKEVYDVNIMRPSMWGNPFSIGADGTREQVIAKYRKHLMNNPFLMEQLYTLKGKRLGCCCKPQPCHGDVIVELIEAGYGDNPLLKNTQMDLFE